jgi:hypothetical protein
VDVVRSRARALVPRALHEASRTAYLALGRSTAAHRLAPSFLILGASRAGTTSLFRALLTHPHIAPPPVNKGVRYFDLNYARGWNWYLGHFPLRWTAQAHTRGATPVAFEASGYYLFHPFAAQRIAKDLPEAKLVAMLRDPVERAYSAWKHETARGYEWEPFERALELETERLRGEVERMRRDISYESFCHRHHSYRSRGEYVDQLERFLTYVPREQLHVIQSEQFFADPQHVYRGLLDFLGLARHEPPTFDVHNARPSKPMPEGVRAELRRHFAPYDARLETLLGVPVCWSGR